jgi:hypothetical protein
VIVSNVVGGSVPLFPPTAPGPQRNKKKKHNNDDDDDDSYYDGDKEQ